MTRLRLPLYAKILAWFALNLAVLALLAFFFLRAQFGLGLDWMLSGEPGERIASIGDEVSEEFSMAPESEWTAMLESLSAASGVRFALFNGNGSQTHGVAMEIPTEVMPKLLDRRPPTTRPPRPIGKRPADAPPKPRFMMRSGIPAQYWAGVHLDLLTADGRRLSLVMASSSISGGGFFFDLWPWIGLIALGLLVSALLWMPFVRGITGFIQSLNQAADRIALGNFDERIHNMRHDELGQLSVSVNAMAAQLGDYVREQRRITADVAHELCSPIARMQLALGVMEQRSTPEQETYLKKLDYELQHMARLVEEVLAFSKAATLPEREVADEFSLRALVDDVVAREAPDTPVKLDVVELQLHTLRSAIDRALGNVLRNAVRYGNDIELHATVEGGSVEIKLQDRGPGVPEEAVSRLFEPFYRPEAARNRNTGGSGLGLAITKRCLESCGGSVTANNREGGGLVVRITVPQKYER
jgi:two-component system sensor histidine kinase CpxA